MVTKEKGESIHINFTSEDIIDSMKCIEALRDFFMDLPRDKAGRVIKSLETALKVMDRLQCNDYKDPE